MSNPSASENHEWKGRILKPYSHLQNPLPGVRPRQQAAQCGLGSKGWASRFILK